MHIHDIFQLHPTTFSFEFFPPKTDEASQELFANIVRLQELQPSFVSVTYGAGGSTRERTHDLVVRIHRETNLTAVSHLTCVCHTRDELAGIVDRYAASGIENILALGGDPPRDLSNYDRSKDAFAHAEGLVRFIKARAATPGSRGFGVGVAGFPEGHPATPNRLKRLPSERVLLGGGWLVVLGRVVEQPGERVGALVEQPQGFSRLLLGERGSDSPLRHRLLAGNLPDRGHRLRLQPG